MTVATAPGYGPGAATRLRDPLVPAIFFASFAAILAVSLVVLWRTAPAGPGAPCVSPVDCPPPPAPPRLVVAHPWKSASLGYSLEFDDSSWALDKETKRGLQLENDDAVVWIRGLPGSDARAAFDMGRRHVDRFAFELVPNRQSRRVLGPSVGYRRGIGAAYCATTPYGDRTDVIVLAASDGRVSVVATVITADCDQSPGSPDESPGLRQVDAILNTFRWPSEAGGTA